MPVFISYRHTDRVQAMAINARLKLANIKTYLDVLDTESQQTDDITAVITRNITECTHLLAVVSQETAMSWWVPFEIGEATISDRRICSYKIGSSALPLYLDKWPKLSGDTDLDFFIDAYRKEAMSERSLGMESFSESIRGTYKSDADLFHDQLKNRIRRGY
ncbi:MULTISPECIES: toll/interleukin-1 receptor domain-containing protein [Pseudomonas]|uniref:toll/interleukin-1 receptor domain-containing protein n=1 Tax=Pseudomonas TaxID=286 RepID=UPI0011F21C8C|nr:toll/interleukin-1 receptor domain-containing protein [Pseudomonas sp. ANT_J28]KAA0982731.1 toll/interleukin-1 receptor domain-containing protein [Pseudomonas sp. ANT_J28]